MQYQYPPYFQNQTQYQPNNYPHYQQQFYPPQNSHLLRREQFYEPTQYQNNHLPNYQQPQQHFQHHNVGEASGYWPVPHNMPAVIQRQKSRSHLPLAPSISQTKINAPIHEVVYEQQQLNPPQSIRQVQYIPYQKRYVDYVAQRVQVPVEKYMTDYYEIQHVVDFVPREYEDTVVQMVPEQVIRYRLEYVPVQKKIVHMNKQDVVNFQKNAVYGQKIQPLPFTATQLNNVNTTLHKQLNTVIPAQSQQNRVNMEGSRISNKSNLSRRSRKTNYVTADNYNPSYREEELYQQSRVINNMNNIDDRFMKRQTEKQYRNTNLTQSNASRGFR